MEIGNNLTDGLIEIAALKGILGYKDSRSICSWCSEKNIQIISLGKKNYISQKSWDYHLNGVLQLSNPTQSNLADQSGGLAGNSSIVKNNSGSFTANRSGSNSSLKEVIEKYKNKING